MKMNRRILAILTCLILVMSLPNVAFAAASQTFFIKNSYGYRCVGSGSISGTTGKSTFTAETIPSQMQTIPPYTCECKVWVYVYDRNGRLLGGKFDFEGTVSAVTEYTADTSIGKIESAFTFNAVDLGYYTLYNS